jgi:NitT/TauT family transport system ATP-binding protein
VKLENHGAAAITGVSKAFGAAPVLDNCSLEVPARSFTALVGPSGCGKTTLINMIAGYELPDKGVVAVDGVPIEGPGWDRLVVFQESALFPWKTTMANVVFGPINRGIPKQDATRQASELLARFGLAGFEQKYPSQLSGGMQRRAELARAMINGPRIMLLDEPFRGLDALTRELMQEYLLRVFEENRITTLFVTTEIEEAIYLADRIVVLSGRPATVKETVEVKLPRPREIQMLSTAEFSRTHGRILTSLIEEAEKAFGVGSEAAADILRGAAEIMQSPPYERVDASVGERTQ